VVTAASEQRRLRWSGQGGSAADCLSAVRLLPQALRLLVSDCLSSLCPVRVSSVWQLCTEAEAAQRGGLALSTGCSG
jgi:hypothetical protein